MYNMSKCISINKFVYVLVLKLQPTTTMFSSNSKLLLNSTSQEGIIFTYLMCTYAQ